MKFVLISNNIPASQTYIANVINTAWQKLQKSDGRKKKEILCLKGDNKNIDLICSETQFDAYDFQKNAPEYILIVPELMWSANGVNEGYEAAHRLLTQKLKNHFFQLVFLSVLNFKQISSNVEKKHLGLLNAFPHFCLLEDNNIVLENYSQVHFELVKSLATTGTGRVGMLEHDLSNIKNNLQSAYNENTISRLKHQLDELSVFHAWTDQNINSINAELEKPNTTPETIKGIIHTLEDILFELKTKLDIDAKVDIAGKSNYKVLIIEDEKHFRELFVKTFSDLFHTVNPNTNDEIVPEGSGKVVESTPFNINNAIEIIKTQAAKHQIIVLDLLYKDKHGAWLNFNGLDLYLLVKKINPYACIRIFTSLPRDVVSRIIEKAINIKIPVSHVFTKKVGEQALTYNIKDRAVEMIMECKENEQKKSIYKPYPKEGIFNGEGIPNFMFRHFYETPDVLETYIGAALGFFEKYKNNELRIDSPDWNSGELPSPKMINSASETYFLGKLKSIMTHRLIAIENALKSDSFSVYYDAYIEVLSGFTNLKAIDRVYFTSKLGFNAKQTGNDFFSIDIKNLFPHEIDYIANTLNSRYATAVLKDEYPELYKWFIEILRELITYEWWDEMKLGYKPYQNTASIDDIGIIKFEDLDSNVLNNLKVPDISDFFKALLLNYNELEQLADLVLSEKPLKCDAPEPIERLLEQLYNTD